MFHRRDEYATLVDILSLNCDILTNLGKLINSKIVIYFLLYGHKFFYVNANGHKVLLNEKKFLMKD